MAVFENYKIRRIYDEASETWYFSVVDIVAALIQQPDYQAARNYWKVLKNRLTKEGSESVTKCNRLEVREPDMNRTCATPLRTCPEHPVTGLSRQMASPIALSVNGLRRSAGARPSPASLPFGHSQDTNRTWSPDCRR